MTNNLEHIVLGIDHRAPKKVEKPTQHTIYSLELERIQENVNVRHILYRFVT